MKISTLLASAALGLTLLSFGSEAQACTVTKAADPCAAIAPTGHKYHGSLNQKLDKTVTICHPNWDRLNRKWYSYAIFTKGQLNQLVNALQKRGSWNQEVELPEGKRCHERYRGENWQFAVFDPCVVEGYNVLRIANPGASGSVLDSQQEWQIVKGGDGKPLLFKL